MTEDSAIQPKALQNEVSDDVVTKQIIHHNLMDKALESNLANVNWDKVQ